MALEDATKVIQAFLYSGKEYICAMQLHADVPESNIRQVLAEFTGEIYQKPPLRSSVKREPRKRFMYEIEVYEIEGRVVLFRCACQGGTYMRKLCSDIGEVLSCGAHMRELRRTRAGLLTEENGLVTLHELSGAQDEFEAGNESALRAMIRPMETALSSMPQIMIRDSAVDAVCHGAELAIPGIVKVDSQLEKNRQVSVLSLKGEAVALGRALLGLPEILEKEKGVAVKTERVLMERGTYPAMWKH